MSSRLPIDAGYEGGGGETELKGNKVCFYNETSLIKPIISFVDTTTKFRHR